MKSPSRNDVTAMADIMKALNGDTTAIKKTATSGSVDSHAGMSNKQQETAAMLKIMNAMNNVDAVSENVAEALYESSKTRTGFKIGAYEISKNDSNLYDVVDIRLKETLFEDIKLKESASVIAVHLNEGKKINSPEITKIISTNAIFETYYYDAMKHKNAHRLAKGKQDRRKMNIAEDRFSRAKNEAMTAKSSIKLLYEAAMKQQKI
jgi:hypothetical protein